MVEEILENLISQFTDPLTFYRELIQNALDAGSNAVHVDITWRPDPAAAIIEVTDFGEGMNRDIIASELTRLFSSSKEDDFTKIGKFGIGFVSVFAITPELVVVDTGRDGESWRVVFDGSPLYQCLRLESPVEGTRVRLYKAMARTDFDDFVSRSKDRVCFWCRYSDAPIYFNGTTINQTLSIESPLVVQHRQPGTEVVIGVSPQTPPLFGLYNRGLTLMEGHDASFWPGVAFRLKSRYLEHTLTRDSVLLDVNYHKAIRILKKVASEQVPPAFFARVKELLAAEDDGGLERLLIASVPYLTAWRRTLPRAMRDVPLFPTLHGAPLSINQLLRAGRREGAIYAQLRADHVTRTLASLEVPVLRSQEGSGLADAVAGITGFPPLTANHVVAAPSPCADAEAHQQLQALKPRLEMLLSDSRVSFEEIVLSDFRYDGSTVLSRPFLLQADAAQPIRLLRTRRWWEWGASNRLLINASHPLVQAALHRSHDAPLIGAYAMAKAVLLYYGLSDRMEARLLSRAFSARPRPDDNWFTHLKALLTGLSSS